MGGVGVGGEDLGRSRDSGEALVPTDPTVLRGLSAGSGAERTMAFSHYSGVEAAPPDAIFGLDTLFDQDPRTFKVKLTAGVYQNEDGALHRLPVVQKAHSQFSDVTHAATYNPQKGIEAYLEATQRLLLGEDSSLLSSEREAFPYLIRDAHGSVVGRAVGRVVSLQSLGGTGALALGADFIRRHLGKTEIYLSNPTWANHNGIMADAGLEVRTYGYLDPVTKQVDFAAMKLAIESLPEGSVVLLHAVCHNPTGADLTQDQWRDLADIFKKRNLMAFFDFAYQGFAEGNAEDAFAIRHFAEKGLTFQIAQSFSKSMSLYDERVGNLTIITGNPEEHHAVLSQVSAHVRRTYSSPPRYGATLAGYILTDPKLRGEWEEQVGEMRKRIAEMRGEFVNRLETKLEELGFPDQDFSFVNQQRGMFTYSGLSQDEVSRLKENHAIYMVGSGRISMAGLNHHNLDQVVNAIAEERAITLRAS